MNKLVSAFLITAAFGYTLVVAFFVVFTISFSGFEKLGSDLTGFAIFCAIALSPLIVWRYCLKRAAAWRRGEHPPF